VAHRIIYSPFGFRILRTLRPLILEVKKIEEEPSLSVSMFDFSGGEKMGKDMRDDDDDLEAVIMMLNTV
jgi:hypothetical protein